MIWSNKWPFIWSLDNLFQNLALIQIKNQIDLSKYKILLDWYSLDLRGFWRLSCWLSHQIWKLNPGLQFVMWEHQGRNDIYLTFSKQDIFISCGGPEHYSFSCMKLVSDQRSSTKSLMVSRFHRCWRLNRIQKSGIKMEDMGQPYL